MREHRAVDPHRHDFGHRLRGLEPRDVKPIAQRGGPAHIPARHRDLGGPYGRSPCDDDPRRRGSRRDPRVVGELVRVGGAETPKTHGAAPEAAVGIPADFADHVVESGQGEYDARVRLVFLDPRLPGERQGLAALLGVGGQMTRLDGGAGTRAWGRHRGR